MKPFYEFINIRALLFGPLAVLVLASCSSYQYSGYESDGIYSSDARVTETETQEEQSESYENTLYYKQIFAQEAERLDYVTQGSGIFTDVESYSSGAYEGEAYAEDQYQGAYGGWGDQADEVVINIYANPYYHTGYLNPYWYSGYRGYTHWAHHGYGFGYGYGYGYGYYPRHASWKWRFGVYNEWGYGFNPYNHYNMAYGGYYGPLYGGYGYYGRGYYGRGYHGYPSYYGDNVAYNNNSRRNSYSDYGNRNGEVSASRVDGYSSSDNVRRSRVSNKNSVTRSSRVSNDERTYRTRRTRVESTAKRSNNTYRQRNTNSRSEPAARRTRSNRSEPAVRRSTQTRSRGTYRSSTSTTRSSGSRRSSSSRSSRGGGRG